MAVRRLSISENLADWEECPYCAGKICRRCEGSGNPGYVWVANSGDN